MAVRVQDLHDFIYPVDPAKVTLTSGFRPPDRPDHHGVDWAAPGTHYIYAAASGVVRLSYTSDSYGEVIYIVHNVNGQQYETVYAHMRTASRLVFPGDTVSQGQHIGIMGNTGDSSGQHLHFEIHKPSWNDAKSNAIDPIPLLENGEWTPPVDPPDPKPVEGITLNRHSTNMRRMGVRGRR